MDYLPGEIFLIISTNCRQRWQSLASEYSKTFRWRWISMVNIWVVLIFFIVNQTKIS